MAGFIERELDRVSERVRDLDVRGIEYERLYAVQQALSFALDPNGFRSPYDWVFDAPLTASQAMPTPLLPPAADAIERLPH